MLLLMPFMRDEYKFIEFLLCLQLLLELAEQANLKQKISDMFGGEQINSTEDRAVLHVATRARRDQASTNAV